MEGRVNILRCKCIQNIKEIYCHYVKVPHPVSLNAPGREGE